MAEANIEREAATEVKSDTERSATHGLGAYTPCFVVHRKIRSDEEHATKRTHQANMQSGSRVDDIAASGSANSPVPVPDSVERLAWAGSDLTRSGR